VLPGFSLGAGGGISGASSPGDVYVTPTVTIGGIASPLKSGGLSGLDPVTLVAGVVILGVLAWVALKR
jgi:hypothetical protein